MIITRSWLSEWIDLSDISTEFLAKTLNQIGLEVDRVVTYSMPEKIVFAKVLECEKHPEADKLNICQVDIGSSIRQIVCGASNVRAGLIVAAATLGANMPNGMQIKPVKLRGIDSDGMICSAKELGLEDIGTGIMEIDESIGTFKLGDEISSNMYFNDDLIEIELTANRGDCLSVMGVARDLAAAFNKPFKIQEHIHNNEENHIGIGRILQVTSNEVDNVDLQYQAVELSELQSNLLMTLRLSQVDEVQENDLDAFLMYSTYATGVVLRAYKKALFSSDEKAKIIIAKDEQSYSVVKGDTLVSTIGVSQEKNSRVEADGTIILEASYVSPDFISRQMYEHKIEKDTLFYRTSRGSEPQLALGMSVLVNCITRNSKSIVYSGSIEINANHEKRVISLSLEEVNSVIGMDIEKRVITAILQDLGFDITKSQSTSFVVGVPQYRHDIVNKQDIIEEIVRMVGIDNIVAKPSQLHEENRFNSDYELYKKRQSYRHKAASQGFYESVHFIFNERIQLEKYNFTCVDDSLELINPIVNTLDTLRPTLMLGLLNAASLNKKNGKQSIALFEVGSTFSSTRDEAIKMGLLFSGNISSDSISNSGKPQKITFDTFVQKLSNIIGTFDLVQDTEPLTLAHPYQSANIYKNEKFIGKVFKVHPTAQADFDLDDSYLCELDFSTLEYELKVANTYSKYQASFRDLSLVVSQEVKYEKIKAIIEESLSKEIVRFYPVDRYSDEKLGDNMSLTLRFVLQSFDKTLEEDDITTAMSGVLDILEEKLGVTLR